jgi:hypothetical protein
MIDTHYFNKASVGIGRYRSITMLTPAAQEKKDIRIAEKLKATA